MNAVKTKSGKHSISALFIFMLIGVYAVFSLLLVLIGVGAYQGVVEDGQGNAQVRTTLSYIANKVRAADAEGMVTVDEWHGMPSLLLRERSDGAIYETRIYFLPDEHGPGGAVCEHFAYEGDDWGPDSGDRIVTVSGLDISQEDNLIVLNLSTADGQSLALRLRLRGAAV